MDAYTAKMVNRVYDKKEQEHKQKKALERKRKKLTPEEKVQIIKERYGLTHGGTKQNKKKKKGRKK